MPNFSSLISIYRKLDSLARREKDRSEYHDDRALWVGLGVAVAVALGILTTFVTPDARASLLVASASSAITIPFGRKIANYLWTQKVEDFSTSDRYLNNEKLVDEELRREIARIRSLSLTEKQATPLLIQAYKESIRKRKSYLKKGRIRSISDSRPEVWNYVPSETRKTQDRLLLLEAKQTRKAARAKQRREAMERERIANEIKKLEQRHWHQ